MEDIDRGRWALLAGDWLIEEKGEAWAREIRLEVKEIIHSLCHAAITSIARPYGTVWVDQERYLMEVYHEIKEIVSSLPPQLVQISQEDRELIAAVQTLLGVSGIPGISCFKSPEGILSDKGPIDLRWHS